MSARPEKFGQYDPLYEPDIEWEEDVIAVYRDIYKHSEGPEILHEVACRKISDYLTYKEKYEDKILNYEEFDEVAETAGIHVKNLGGSGLHLGHTWFTVYMYNFIENYRIGKDEFSIYL